MKKGLGDPFLRLHLRPSRPLRSGDFPPRRCRECPFATNGKHLSLCALLLTGLYFGVRYHSICMSAAMVSIPSQRFYNRMLSFDECWLLSWLAIGIVIV